MRVRRWLVPATLTVALLAQGPTAAPAAEAAAVQGRVIMIRALKDINTGPGETVKLHIRARVGLQDPKLTPECRMQVPVRFQRWDRQNKVWRLVGKATTNDRGVARANLKHRLGRYRAVVRQVTVLETTVCGRAVDRARHTHD